ncbi:MAG: hypothetical protein M3N13_05290, partial [Candidatus Eremiobacteraeota bacterium]|nr:hypothetical protein [Candidatus Eremiobacteraeota bacterium]
TYVETLRAHVSAARVVAIQYTPAAILFSLGWTEASATIAGAAAMLAVGAVAIFGLAKTRERTRRFAIVCSALPLLSGFAHEHNFTLLFIPALWAMRTLTLRAQAIVVFAFGMVAVNWMDFAQQPGAAGQDVVLGVGALMAILAWAPARSPHGYVGAAAAAVVLVSGAWIGMHHPAPIWPNDMRPFHIPFGASSAYIWHVEQIRSGLERVEPAWGLLRSFSLAGSFLMLAAASFAGKALDVDVHEIVERRDRIGVEVL